MAPERRGRPRALHDGESVSSHKPPPKSAKGKEKKDNPAPRRADASHLEMVTKLKVYKVSANLKGETLKGTHNRKFKTPKGYPNILIFYAYDNDKYKINLQTGDMNMIQQYLHHEGKYILFLGAEYEKRFLDEYKDKFNTDNQPYIELDATIGAILYKTPEKDMDVDREGGKRVLALLGNSPDNDSPGNVRQRLEPRYSPLKIEGDAVHEQIDIDDEGPVTNESYQPAAIREVGRAPISYLDALSSAPLWRSPHTQSSSSSNQYQRAVARTHEMGTGALPGHSHVNPPKAPPVPKPAAKAAAPPPPIPPPAGILTNPYNYEESYKATHKNGFKDHSWNYFTKGFKKNNMVKWGF
jgi:hypothetical protein